MISRDHVDPCRYCQRINVPGSLCPSHNSSGELVEVLFICDACQTRIVEEIDQEQDWWDWLERGDLQ